MTIWLILWEMVGGLDFGRISGVEMISCVLLFLPYLLYPWIRRLGWGCVEPFWRGSVGS